MTLAGVAAAALGLAALAQVTADRGIAPVAASADIEVSGIKVDTTGKTAQEARENGWREAQRLAWKQIGGPNLADGQLAGLVSAIVIEQERIGPSRYLATLTVIFDRGRAGGLLGRAGQAARSAPLLLIPVTVSAGTATTFEVRNDWQRAWAEFQAGGSRSDDVGPSGAGAQSLLVNYGQTTRRSRNWWRNVLDEFAASDVIMAIAELDYTFPGGPVRGVFTARYGPDSTQLAQFTLTAPSAEALPAMLAQAVRRFDAIYTSALDNGVLKPDPTLSLAAGQIDPRIQRLIEVGRQLESGEAQRAAAARAAAQASTQPQERDEPAPAVVTAITVQFASNDVASFDAALAAIRSVPGVQSSELRSQALGGTSVASVQFAGSPADLAAALAARGYTVQGGGTTISISR